MRIVLRRAVAAAAFLLLPGLSSAAVMSFTPAGTTTVPQDTDLYWNFQSSATSTTTMAAPCDFYLSDHGDFHWNSNGDMVVLSNNEGGAPLASGTLIGPSSRWDRANFANEYAGTTEYSGTMVPPQTAYFGTSCVIGGQKYYGWVQITEGATTQSVLAWAYESTPNTPIAAGATTSVAKPSTAIPTLSEWAMIAMSLALAGMALVRLRRRG